MLVLGIGIITLIFLGDLWIKNKIESTLNCREIRETLGGKLLIRKYHNRGAALNLGENRQIPCKIGGKRGNYSVVTVVSLLLCIVMTVVFVLSFTRSGSHLLHTGLSLLLGGAYSNAYDRLKRGYVVDYFSFGAKWKKLRSIVFNISDFCIIIGAVIAAIGAYRS